MRWRGLLSCSVGLLTASLVFWIQVVVAKSIEAPSEIEVINDYNAHELENGYSKNEWLIML